MVIKDQIYIINVERSNVVTHTIQEPKKKIYDTFLIIFVYNFNSVTYIITIKPSMSTSLTLTLWESKNLSKNRIFFELDSTSSILSRKTISIALPFAYTIVVCLKFGKVDSIVEIERNCTPFIPRNWQIDCFPNFW